MSVKERPQGRWQKKNGYISKTYKLRQDVVAGFAAACQKSDISQARQLTVMMEEFIKQSNEPGV